MNKNIDVTILITVYNGANTLDRCLESIFTQTYKQLAVFCVDDASKDNTGEILKRWQKKFGTDRFTIVTNKDNMGVTRSSCLGLDLIKTKYAARLDADDWFAATKIEKQIAFMKKNPDYKIVGCNYININKHIKKRILMVEHNEQIRHEIIKRNPFAHSCVVFETEAVLKIGKYDTSVRYGADYDLFLRMFPHTKYYNFQEFLCFRSIEADGISIKKQRDQMLQCVKSKIKYIKRYSLSRWNYIYLIEPLIVAYTPRFIRDIKRAIMG